MKIGIVSMQRIINNGSFLQAYALYETLKQKGHTVEFIDFPMLFETPKTNKFIKFARKIKHNIIPKYKKIAKVRKYNALFAEKFKKSFYILGMSEQLNFAKNTEYDLVIIGSDEVFNIMPFTESKYGIPWVLLGEGIKCKKLISYAGSFGQTTPEQIADIGELEHAKKLFSAFDAVSVRDESSLQSALKLGVSNPHINIDPVLMYENFPKDEQYKKLPYKYLLVYSYPFRMSSPDEIEAVRQFAKKEKLKIVCVNMFQTWGDKFIVASPFALLQYIKDAQYVVTDTFHGTVFSIINNTPFATFIRPSNANKLGGLLKQFSLESRRVDDVALLDNVLNTQIDFESVNKCLKIERKKSKDYLESYTKENS